jgi:hypothetical protein
VYNLPPVVTAGALQALPGATHAPHPFCHHRAYDRNGSALVQAGVYQVTPHVTLPRPDRAAPRLGKLFVICVTCATLHRNPETPT